MNMTVTSCSTWCQITAVVNRADRRHTGGVVNCCKLSAPVGTCCLQSSSVSLTTPVVWRQSRTGGGRINKQWRYFCFPYSFDIETRISRKKWENYRLESSTLLRWTCLEIDAFFHSTLLTLRGVEGRFGEIRGVEKWGGDKRSVGANDIRTKCVSQSVSQWV